MIFLPFVFIPQVYWNIFQKADYLILMLNQATAFIAKVKFINIGNIMTYGKNN